MTVYNFTDNFSNKRIENIYYFLFPLLLLGLLYNYFNFIIILLMILIRIITTNKNTAAIYLILYGRVLGGVIREGYPNLQIYGSAIMLLGVLIVYKQIKLILPNTIVGWRFLFFTFIIFFLFFLYGPQHNYSVNKLSNILVFGSVSFIIFFFYNEDKTIDNNALAQLLVLTAIALFYAGIEIFHYNRPNNILDFTWFRDAAYETYNNFEQRYTGLGWQNVGINIAMGTAFYFANRENKNKLLFVFMGLINLYMGLMSGSRQAFFSVALIIIARIIFFNKKYFIMRLGFIAVFIILLFQLLNNLDIKYINYIINPNVNATIESISGREYNILRAFDIIGKNFFFGLGLGGYSPSNMGIYPHNIILEILSEMGIVGLCFLVGVISLSLYKNRTKIMASSNNNSYFFIVVLAMMIRSFISSDLGENIIVFSAIFAWSNSRINYNKVNYN